MSAIEEILREAGEAGASDVHLTVGVPPRMRVNGKLVTMNNYSGMLQTDTLDILLEIMSETQRERFEGRGEYDFSFSIPDCGRFRVNAYRQRGSVALAFRLVGNGVPVPEGLGLPESVLELYRKRRGLILVTGPAGSGKSTTLAAIIDRINSSREVHIITLEDPIEYVHPHRTAMVSQREIGIDCGNYEEAMKAALREDPDVILLGEMKDPDTIAMAVDAAETGCLVLSSLNTVGTADAVDHIVNVFPPYYQQQFRIQLARVLEAVIFQQLIPKSDGQGRAAAFEVLHTNQTVRSLIREGKTGQLSGAISTGRKQGMIAMDEAIIRLYAAGKIDKENAILYARDSDAMARRFAEAEAKKKV
ncbi:MAG: PilT/PilU family type 4a pilus ATPase [Butyrivibrio sp.]|nr:PilT/PilU family type 4a pilus ATPase [Acetatifactor muris]MCM1558100.1 PilT/PilU family type 4a pilus ATPase [Butyrivibrio sp.]MCM1560463.1 PilT/PilU family type 4a pilus ATPase [Butyrivibrio sp.]